MKFEIPQGFKRFEGDMTEDFLDGGFLSVGQQHVYFKLFEDEWAHFKVLSFISPTSRPSGSLFSYKVKIIGKNGGTLPVFLMSRSMIHLPPQILRWARGLLYTVKARQFSLCVIL